jgi:hypothetical protein
MGYAEFLENKRTVDPRTGIENPGAMPSVMLAHQSDITSWALRRGRAAVFAGTGLGKTLIEIAWADRVARHTNKPVLIYAPLAVAAQHVREAEKFGMECKMVRRHADLTVGVNVANYAKMDHFDHSELGGIALDESSILKHHDGKTRGRLIEECAQIPFRLAATATPAPNDFMELGNHAEFLGVMSFTDMLSMFFVHDGGETQKWRLKGHAEDAFWKWMCSWSVMLRSPSDLGYPNDGYDLPPLIRHQHTVESEPEFGSMFSSVAGSLQERISARRDTVAERVDLAAKVTGELPDDEPIMWWANLNAEADALCREIDGAVQVTGSERDEAKEEKILDFLNGKIKRFVSKGSIMGYGLNFQHCAHTGLVGLNDSFEQTYQIIRRFWRFGQMRDVHAHFIASEREGAVVANLARKEADADRMAAAMVRHMSDISSIDVRGAKRDRPDYNPQMNMIIPGAVL